MSGGVVVDTTRLVLAMQTLGHGIDRSSSAAASATASDVANRARAAVPHRSGRLAASVHVDTVEDGAAATMSTPYAGWIEFGGTRGRPYVSEGRYLGGASRGADLAFAKRAEVAIQQIARLL